MSALNSITLRAVSSEDNQLVAGTVGLAKILTSAAVYYAFSSKNKGARISQTARCPALSRLEVLPVVVRLHPV